MLIGHEKQWQFLKKSVELGKISHAYLFCGEEGFGKKAVAKEFIKLLQCQGQDSVNPCQRCFSCLQIERGFHPDLTLVEPINKEIQISQIRNLCWTLSLKPYAASYKTAIIDGAENMNSEAANALLKTLEEPSGRAVLILITSHPEMLPRTVASRTQIIRFFPVPKIETESFLKKQNLTENEAQELISLSEGRPGKLLKFLSSPQELEKEKLKLKEIAQISQSDLSFRFQYVKKVIDTEENLDKILENWLRYFRNSLFSAISNKQSSSLVKLKNVLKLIQTINFLVSTTNVNPRLALEMIMLEL